MTEAPDSPGSVKRGTVSHEHLFGLATLVSAHLSILDTNRKPLIHVHILAARRSIQLTTIINYINIDVQYLPNAFIYLDCLHITLL